MWTDNYYIYEWIDEIAASIHFPDGTLNSASKTVVDLPKAVYNTNGEQKTTADIYSAGARRTASPLAPPWKGIAGSSDTVSDYEKLASYIPNLVIGSGTTTDKASDYKLEAEIKDNLVCLGVLTARDAAAGTITHTKTMQNTGASAITVGEIGLVVHFDGVGNTLIYREVFDNPITANSGEVFSVTIKHQIPVLWN